MDKPSRKVHQHQGSQVSWLLFGSSSAQGNLYDMGAQETRGGFPGPRSEHMCAHFSGFSLLQQAAKATLGQDICCGHGFACYCFWIKTGLGPPWSVGGQLKLVLLGLRAPVSSSTPGNAGRSAVEDVVVPENRLR
ncbi:hypothetical protein DPEC_G00292620 [Dallia pectoralis]|uniref:Uncharacterized protein n=1 Tax=Dallia pectoralis TaxID=75939 RepID=A0ACC2FI62_DALPE|nr:hypothetical protein DPEC_G00292620 [Dallia pectoralis]